LGFVFKTSSAAPRRAVPSEVKSSREATNPQLVEAHYVPRGVSREGMEICKMEGFPETCLCCSWAKTHEQPFLQDSVATIPCPYASLSYSCYICQTGLFTRSLWTRSASIAVLRWNYIWACRFYVQPFPGLACGGLSEGVRKQSTLTE
jgi:hypothetical protein